jgi:hypothetical protein
MTIETQKNYRDMWHQTVFVVFDCVIPPILNPSYSVPYTNRYEMLKKLTNNTNNPEKVMIVQMKFIRMAGYFRLDNSNVTMIKDMTTKLKQMKSITKLMIRDLNSGTRADRDVGVVEL